MSRYKEVIDKMCWSHSRVSCYKQCPYAFYLKYILKDDDLYLPEGNFHSELGSYNHLILEKVFKSELNAAESLDYYLAHYDENVVYETSPSIMEKAYEQCADYYASFETDWLDGYNVLGVEKEINTEIDGKQFIGFIDLLIEKKDTGDIYIIDHKSSPYPFKKDGKSVLKKSIKSFESYKRQLYLYSKAVFEEYGRFPKCLAWNHFKDNKIRTIKTIISIRQ